MTLGRRLHRQAAHEVPPQELEPLLEAHHPRLQRIEPERQIVQHLARQLHRRLRPLPAARQHDEVIGVAHQRVVGVDQRLVQVVEVEVGQRGRQRRALRNAAAGDRGQRAGLLVADRRREPLAHQRDQLGVAVHQHIEPGQQRRMGDGVEEALDVRLHHPGVALALQRRDALHGHAHRATLAVGVAAFLELGLQQRRQRLRHRRLDHPVAHGRDAQRARRLAIRSRQPRPPQRLRRVPAAHDVALQLGQRRLALRREIEHRHAIDARRAAVVHHAVERRFQAGHREGEAQPAGHLRALPDGQTIQASARSGDAEQPRCRSRASSRRHSGV